MRKVTQEDEKIFRKIREVVQRLPKRRQNDDGNEISLTARTLNRGLAKTFCLKCVDGYIECEPERPHSWLLTQNGAIIDFDLEEVMGKSAFIFADDNFTKRNSRIPFLEMYKPMRLPEEITEHPHFVNAVEKIYKEIQKILGGERS